MLTGREGEMGAPRRGRRSQRRRGKAGRGERVDRSRFNRSIHSASETGRDQMVRDTVTLGHIYSYPVSRSLNSYSDIDSGYQSTPVIHHVPAK